MEKNISEVIYFPFEATIVVILIVFLLFKYLFSFKNIVVPKYHPIDSFIAS